jgi:hypothetical protein
MDTSHHSDLLTTVPPIVAVKWLYILSGLMWNTVGVILIRLAHDWLSEPRIEHGLTLTFFGVVSAVIIFHILFLPVSRVNIKRLESLPERVNIFAFQAWYGYPLIILMMSLGIGLRHLSIIPKELLAILYIGIGGAISTAGFNYYIHTNSNNNS